MILQQRRITRKVAKLGKLAHYSQPTNYSWGDNNGMEVSIIGCECDWNSLPDHQSAPLQFDLQTWLRIFHYIHVEVYRVWDCYNFKLIKLNQTYEESPNEIIYDSLHDIPIYEDCLEEGLEAALMHLLGFLNSNMEEAECQD